MKFFKNMDSEDKLMAVIVITGGAILIVYIVASAFAGKAL